MLQANRIVAAQQQHPDGTQVQAHLMEQVRLQVGLTKIRFANAMRASKMQEMSLDSPPPTAAIASDGADALLETIAADEAVGLEDDVCLANLAVQQALQQLPQREATFIQHMYGLVDGIPMNRAQVRPIICPICIRDTPISRHRVFQDPKRGSLGL